MQNSLHQSWKDPPTQSGWSIDAAPRARLVLLFVLFTLPVMLVAARLVWLQVIIPDRFVAAWTQTRETFETIPASDGRIESVDGQVLAFDQPSYAIHVHYRWLEEPVDPAWLKARARELLPKDERRNKAKLEEAQSQILSQREALWQALAELTGHSVDELATRRAEVQKRIETIAQEAEARRANRRSQPSTVPQGSIWSRVWHELSTPPEFAHIPYVAAPATTKKLSKREIGKYRTNPQFKKRFDMADAVLPKVGLAVSEALNPVMVEYYETMGFLPEAVLNALARLGWSLDD
ncbi:MAG: hypothetical protein ACK5CE_24010, partial [Actinomycetes bacterium]